MKVGGTFSIKILAVLLTAQLTPIPEYPQNWGVDNLTTNVVIGAGVVACCTLGLSYCAYSYYLKNYYLKNQKTIKTHSASAKRSGGGGAGLSPPSTPSRRPPLPPPPESPPFALVTEKGLESAQNDTMAFVCGNSNATPKQVEDARKYSKQCAESVHPLHNAAAFIATFMTGMHGRCDRGHSVTMSSLSGLRTKKLPTLRSNLTGDVARAWSLTLDELKEQIDRHFTQTLSDARGMCEPYRLKYKETVKVQLVKQETNGSWTYYETDVHTYDPTLPPEQHDTFNQSINKYCTAYLLWVTWVSKKVSQPGITDTAKQDAITQALLKLINLYESIAILSETKDGRSGHYVHAGLEAGTFWDPRIGTYHYTDSIRHSIVTKLVGGGTLKPGNTLPREAYRSPVLKLPGSS
jgi:hypothetical protein